MQITINEVPGMPLTAKTTFDLTSRQVEALRAAKDQGGAIYVRGSRMGGAIRRMCEALAEQGLVDDWPPFPITSRGHAVLAEIERLKRIKFPNLPPYDAAALRA